MNSDYTHILGNYCIEYTMNYTYILDNRFSNMFWGILYHILDYIQGNNQC